MESEFSDRPKHEWSLNCSVAERSEKANDLGITIPAALKLASGQVKKFFNDDAVMAVLMKYGFEQ